VSRRRSHRGGRSRHPAPSNRTARTASLIRRVVAEGLEEIGDERLAALAVTGVEVDRDLHRAIVWYTTFDDDHDPEVSAALDELWPRLRHEIATRTRLRRAPLLEFRADGALRSAERIEQILAEAAAGSETSDASQRRPASAADSASLGAVGQGDRADPDGDDPREPGDDDRR